MPEDGTVFGFYNDYLMLIELAAVSPSGLAAISRSYPRLLVVASASDLEARIKATISTVVKDKVGASFSSFTNDRVLARNYHQLFDWNSLTAKPFFSSFGPESGRAFKRARENDVYERNHKSFMELGERRNQLVHNNFGSFELEWTAAEVIDRYRNALGFVDSLAHFVRFCISTEFESDQILGILLLDHLSEHSGA